MSIENQRVQTLNQAAPRENAKYVLYWSQMNRRAESNHALAYAAELANQSKLPLLVYEGLTCTYREANDRLHTFVLEGVPDTATQLKERRIGYFFYLRATPDSPDNLLYRLAEQARCIVTDDYPAFIAARHNQTVPAKIGIPYYAVDSSCIVPMSVHEKRAWGAYTIRPKIHRELPAYLKPLQMPMLKNHWCDDLLPPDLRALRTDVSTPTIPTLTASCAINHSIKPSLTFRGGYTEARKHLDKFIENKLARYSAESNQPSKRSTSDISPYLHFGHLSSLEVALAVRDYAHDHRLLAEDFLEELIVRRELAFNFARFAPHPDSLSVLPDWCQRTMQKHSADPRPFLYTPQQFEQADTHDALWNATQKEMLLRGKIHGYYRMYWGKKIIEWSPTYEEALRTMLHIHDVWALDGRDPNTYTNVLWCFGLHDRPWSERPIFGQLRYMSYDGMKRKTNIADYIKEIDYLASTGKDLTN